MTIKNFQNFTECLRGRQRMMQAHLESGVFACHKPDVVQLVQKVL